MRLWNGRIGRWLSPDPYGQYHSPYIGMGNDPVNGIDPDGGWKNRWGRFWGWVGNGFRGKFVTTNSSNPDKKYGISQAYSGLAEGNGIGDLDAVGLHNSFNNENLSFFRNGRVDPVSPPQSTFSRIFDGPYRPGPNGFAVDTYGYQLSFYPPIGGTVPTGFTGGSSSIKLGRNLVKSGVFRPLNSAAHHIVAGNDKRAALARALIKAEKIGINSAKNGVFLPKSSKFLKVKDGIAHSRIHTNKYYLELTKKLQSAGSGNVGKALEQFKQNILNGTVKY